MVYRPIKISELFLDSVLIDTYNKKSFKNTFDGISYYAELLGVPFPLDYNSVDLMDDLIISLCKNSIKEGSLSMENLLKSFVEVKKSEGIFLKVEDAIDIFLIPMLFELWQKDKIVYKIKKDLDETVRTLDIVPISGEKLYNAPQLVWIDSNESPFFRDREGILLCLYPKYSYSKEGKIVKIFVVGWSFKLDNPKVFQTHSCSLNLVCEKGRVDKIELKNENQLNSSYLLSLLSLISLDFVNIEMTDASKIHYKKVEDVSKIKNKFSEVREYNLDLSKIFNDFDLSMIEGECICHTD